MQLSPFSLWFDTPWMGDVVLSHVLTDATQLWVLVICDWRFPNLNPVSSLTSTPPDPGNMAGLGDGTDLVLQYQRVSQPSPQPHDSGLGLTVVKKRWSYCSWWVSFFSLSLWALQNPYFGLMRSLFLAFEYGFIFVNSYSNTFLSFPAVWKMRCQLMLNLSS